MKTKNITVTRENEGIVAEFRLTFLEDGMVEIHEKLDESVDGTEALYDFLDEAGSEMQAVTLINSYVKESR